MRTLGASTGHLKPLRAAETLYSDGEAVFHCLTFLLCLSVKYIAPAASHVTLAPVVEYTAPAASHVTLAPVVEYTAPAVSHVAPAPVNEYIALVSAVNAAPTLVVEHVSHAAVGDTAPALVFECIMPAPVDTVRQWGLLHLGP